MKTMRIAGAQIPVYDFDVDVNKLEIIKALDWAKENGVDELLTPEGSLSGYYSYYWEENLEKIHDALKEVENHQAKCGVGLHLGTNFLSSGHEGFTKRNQIRHYNREGQIYAVTNKTYTVGADGNAVPSFTPCESFAMRHVESQEEERDYVGVGMICNDMWGNIDDSGFPGYRPTQSLFDGVVKGNVDILFHATNAYKYHDDEHTEARECGRKVLDSWTDAWLRQTAFRGVCSILTVDACVQWNWDGNEENIDKYRTSSQSGVLNPLGQWVTDVPRYGRQYFYYDLPLNQKRKSWDIINEDPRYLTT